jgi:toxin-antitoxin system PIN domain toxin
MLLLDANVLIYAFRRDLPQHTTAKRWLETKLSADEPLELLVLSELAFLRITTNRRAFAQPSRFEEALRFLEAVRSCPIVSELHPGPEHRSIFVRVARDYHLTGNDVSDAFVAAAAIEAGAILASADRGFARFRGLRWIDPLRGE